MKDDPIVTEIRKQRMKILNAYDGDFIKMTQDVMKRQWESGHKVISSPAKVIKEGVAENVYPLKNAHPK